MSQPNDDKLLHQWVKQTLHNHSPAYQPQDWSKMQRALRRQRWWWRGKVGLVALATVSIIGWWAWHATHATATLPQTVEVVAPKERALLKDSLPLANKLISVSPPVEDNPVYQSVVPVSDFVPAGSRTFWPEVADLKAHLEVKEMAVPVGKALQESVNGMELEAQSIKHQMLTGQFGPDSTTYHTLSRNLRRWPNAVVVCDLTTSMYPYSTQIFAWLKKNAQRPEVKGMVFFTDCDSLGRKTAPGGPAGQMFVSKGRTVEEALPLMLAATSNTRNNDDAAENDVEALLFAQKRFPEAKHLILLADNASPVKDMALLSQIKKPVHVVLCGDTEDSIKAYQPDYFAIAKQTKGSLHTSEDDINPGQLAASPWVRIGDRYYHYNARKDRFKVTRFRQRPQSFLGLFWY